jgi:hypothetical protein
METFKFFFFQEKIWFMSFISNHFSVIVWLSDYPSKPVIEETVSLSRYKNYNGLIENLVYLLKNVCCCFKILDSYAKLPVTNLPGMKILSSLLTFVCYSYYSECAVDSYVNFTIDILA